MQGTDLARYRLLGICGSLIPDRFAPFLLAVYKMSNVSLCDILADFILVMCSPPSTTVISTFCKEVFGISN